MAITSLERKLRLFEKGFVTPNEIENELDEIVISRIVPVEGEVEHFSTTYRKIIHRGRSLRMRWPLKEGYKYVPTIVKKEESV